MAVSLTFRRRPAQRPPAPVGGGAAHGRAGSDRTEGHHAPAGLALPLLVGVRQDWDVPIEGPTASDGHGAPVVEVDDGIGRLLATFISEAMVNGWLIVEETNDAVPPHLRDLFPTHAGIGFTVEGRQRLAALLAEAGVAESDQLAAGLEPPTSRL